MLHIMRRNYKCFALYLLFVYLFACLGCSGSSGDGSVFLEGPSLEIEGAYVDSVPALGNRERAVIAQGQGEYVGVDNWTAHDPVPAGTRLVNGGTGNLFSMDFSERSTVAYSNYFATEKTREDSMSGGLLNAAFFNGLVQVGPWRQEGTTGDFTYRRFGITYEVVRPMPAAYSVCSNNPQMDTAGAPGGASQFFAPFIRQDLIRLGYVRILDAVDSSLASRASAIPRYVALSGRTTTAEELNQLALDDYTNLVGQRTPEKQELAARLRAEAISLRTDKKRSGNTFSARATSGDMTLGSGARIDGYALVNLFASQNITIQGTIHIENTGANGAVNVLSKAALSADAVEVETGTRLVTRSWVKTGNTWNRVDAPADVYCNQCNWSASSGGDPAPGYSGAWTTVPNRAGPPPPDRSF